MEITIKKAEISDLDELMHWREIVLREVFYIPKEENMDKLLETNREYYSSALENNTHIACFAYDGEKIVGCGGICLYSEMPSPDNPSGKCAYLMNIYTIPDMRKHGVGKMVVEWLIEKAKNQGADKIYLESSDKAYSLYKDLGFEDMEWYLKYKD